MNDELGMKQFINYFKTFQYSSVGVRYSSVSRCISMANAPKERIFPLSRKFTGQEK